MSSSRLTGLDLNLLVVLDALLLECNATRAAARLGLTQSAVSRALARLRSHFDDPLFVRVPGGLSPTPRAEDMAARLRPALDELGRAVDLGAAFDPARAARSFTLSTADLAELAILPALMQRLADEAPGLSIVARAPDRGPARTVEDALESGAVDIALGIFDDAPAAFRCQTLFRGEFVCLVRAGHP
ncbi:MAG: LysR family transcriptional regulator, partial [Myxococcota bacterium]